MRNKYEISASQPTSQPQLHTHEVRCQQNGAVVIMRFWTKKAAEFEKQRLVERGYHAEVKSR